MNTKKLLHHRALFFHRLSGVHANIMGFYEAFIMT